MKLCWKICKNTAFSQFSAGFFKIFETFKIFLKKIVFVVQTRKKVTLGLLNLFDKYAKTMHFRNFIRNFLKIFEVFPSPKKSWLSPWAGDLLSVNLWRYQTRKACNFTILWLFAQRLLYTLPLILRNLIFLFSYKYGTKTQSRSDSSEMSAVCSKVAGYYQDGVWQL